MATIKKCGLVVRVSDPRQAITYKNSFDIQLEELRKHIEAKNSNKDGPRYKEYAVYDLMGVSGSISFESNEFERLRIDIELGKVNVVICTALDRLGRDVAGFIEFFKYLKGNNAELICTRMSLDTSTPTGEAMVIILMALAKLELDIKSERNRKNTQYRARKGLYNGGRPILGYDLNDDPLMAGTLIVNKQEVLIVEEGFRKYLELGSDSAVAKHLSGKGYRNKSWKQRSTGKRMGGGGITENVVRTILTNIKYIALREYSDINEKTGEKVTLTTNASWESIIDVELFYEVQDARKQALLAKGNIARKQKEKGHFYLVLGNAVCVYCGEEMKSRSGKQHGRTYYYYSCMNDSCPESEEMYPGRRSRFHINAEEADKATYSVIESVISSDTYLTKLRDMVNKSILDDIPKLKGELVALTRKSRETKTEVLELSKSLPAFEEGTKEYALNFEHIEKQTEVHSKIEERKLEVKSILDDKNAQKISKAEIKYLLTNMQRLAEYGPRKQRRDLVRYLFSNIEIDNEKMVFNLHVDALRYIYRMSTRDGGFEQIGKWRLDEDSNLGPSG